MSDCLLELRDKFLVQIGFASYGDYLQSDLWAWIRTRLMELDESKRCQFCGSTMGLVWHHTTYAPNVLVGNFSSNDGFIVRLCNDCHRSIHFKKDTWCLLKDANERFIALRRLFQDASINREKWEHWGHKEYAAVRGDLDKFVERASVEFIPYVAGDDF